MLGLRTLTPFRLRPVARAAVTSGIVMAAGDVICQKVQQRKLQSARIDWLRTARFSLIGVTLHGPYFFAGFQWLDALVKGPPTLHTALKKTLTGQFSLFPVYLATFFTYMGLLEGKPILECIDKVRHSFLPTFATGTIFWPVANIINFRYVPSSGRVLYVNICGLFWNAFLSWANSR